MSDENETDAIEEAGRWYRDVLIAVGQALHEAGMPHTFAGSFVASLARQGFTIEREPGAPGSLPAEGQK